jgi:hypothetical protein
MNILQRKKDGPIFFQWTYKDAYHDAKAMFVNACSARNHLMSFWLSFMKAVGLNASKRKCDLL